MIYLREGTYRLLVKVMSEVKAALRETKKKLSDVVGEVKGMVDSLRPEEPLLRKTRHILGSPVRRRVKRRLSKYRAKREGEE